MRTLVIAGKIGPAFRDDTSVEDSRVLVEVVKGDTYTMGIGNVIHDTAKATKRARSCPLAIMMDCIAKDYFGEVWADDPHNLPAMQQR